MPCELCHHDQNHHIECLEHVSIFAGLNRQEMEEIAKIATARDYDKGEIVYHAGEQGGTLYVLHTGRVKLSRLNVNGKEQVLRVVEPGEFIGELSLFSSLPLTDNAEVLKASTMCTLQGDRMKELMIKYPSIAFKVMDELSRRLEAAENRIETISLSPVAQRLAQTLLELSQGTAEIRLPMTKGDLASQLSMSQETLSRKLAAMQEEGLISLKGHRGITIRDRDALEALSEAE